MKLYNHPVAPNPRRVRMFAQQQSQRSDRDERERRLWTGTGRLAAPARGAPGATPSGCASRSATSSTTSLRTATP